MQACCIASIGPHFFLVKFLDFFCEQKEKDFNKKKNTIYNLFYLINTQ